MLIGQGFRLDRRVLAVYLGLLSAACARVPSTLVPDRAVPVPADRVDGWIAETVPAEFRLHRFKWTFRDERATAGGRGAARVAPPDSLRVDVAGPFNSEATAAVVVGSELQWAEPADRADELVSNEPPLMWAMFGVAWEQPTGAREAAFEDGQSRIWRKVAGADTVEYARIGGDKPKFVALLRRAGHFVGMAEARFAPDGTLASARLSAPNARLDLDFYANQTPESFPPDLWLPPGR